MTSAMPVQCSNQLSYEVTQLRAGQFVGLMFSRERKVMYDTSSSRFTATALDEEYVSTSFGHKWGVVFWPSAGAHQMEHLSPLISWVNPFPSRFINSIILFCNARESHECASSLLFDVRQYYLHFSIFIGSLSARETYSGNCSVYKSTRERVDSKVLKERWRLHLMGSCRVVFRIWRGTLSFHSLLPRLSSLYCTVSLY